MSLTVAQAVERAFYRVSKTIAEKEGAFARYMIESFLDDGLRRMADDISTGKDESADPYLLHKLTSNISLASGIAAIPTNIIVHTIARQGSILANGGSSSLPLQFLPEFQDLVMGGRSEDWEYFSILGGTSVSNASIHVRKFDGSISGAATIDIRAGVYPESPSPKTASGLFVNLPVQLEDNFIDYLVEIALEKMGVPGNPPPASTPS